VTVIDLQFHWSAAVSCQLTVYTKVLTPPKGHFAKRLSNHDVVHYKTYPKTPKMNVHCERFNRTIQECFVDYHEDLLFTDPPLFNQKMSDWPVFHNTKLPHLSTKSNSKKTASLTNFPVAPTEFLLKTHPQSSMDWTNTYG
jgi:hypothetical protein